MTQKNNILQELQELNSNLAAHTPEPVYQVPAGYFDSLAQSMLTRIRAMEAASAGEELLILSPTVSHLPKLVPYTVPQGYFEELISRLMKVIRASEAATAREEIGHLSPLLSGLSQKMPFSVPQDYFDQLPLEDISNQHLSAKEELENLSPLLGSLKKEMPYEVPQGYFENIQSPIVPEEKKPAAKVVRFGAARWMRYAAAAVVAGLIITFAFVFIKKDKITADKDSFAWVEKNVKKVSDEKLDEFIQLADAEKAVASADSKNKQEITELLKDVPEEEIQSLLEDTKDLEDDQAIDISEDALMN
ncbi:MAG: hypothetical protein JNM88_16530 [Chitinophagaceae bacterium]|nr:hypothetical protein [Chitinophagaceae bacterium]